MPFDNENGDREFAKPTVLADWLEEFANNELKNANPFEDIRNLFQQKSDTLAVEKRVQELREQIGLDKIAKKNDDIFGGLGDEQPDERYDQEQLEKGTKVELEHTNDPEKAKEITKDHLEESKDFCGNKGGEYYDELAEMEEEIEKKLVGKAKDIKLLKKLIILANKLEDEGYNLSARAVDRTIKRLAKSLKKDIFEKHPELRKTIENICVSRGGHVDVPAVLSTLQSENKDLKLTDQDKEQLKKYIKQCVKENKKEIETNDDISGMSYVVFVVNEDDGNDNMFGEPARM